MNHELKIQPKFYKRVADGSMNFGIDDIDLGIQSGDSVVFKEWDPTPVNATNNSPKGYTGSKDLEFQVGYVHFLDRGTVIFSLLPPKSKKAK